MGTNDPGYLLARLLINHENRFFVEGEKQVSVYNKLSDQPIRHEDLKRPYKAVAVDGHRE